MSWLLHIGAPTQGSVEAQSSSELAELGHGRQPENAEEPQVEANAQGETTERVGEAEVTERVEAIEPQTEVEARGGAEGDTVDSSANKGINVDTATEPAKRGAVGVGEGARGTPSENGAAGVEPEFAPGAATTDQHPDPETASIDRPMPSEASMASGEFFDPQRLNTNGGFGSALQVHGFVAVNFYVTQRTNTRQRDADGTLSRLPSISLFDVGSTTLYFGAPVFTDLVYARIALELLFLPNQQSLGTTPPDVLGAARRALFVETAALELLVLGWVKHIPRWVGRDLKLTLGIFVVPFGLEDIEHAAPTNWFSSRPLSMTQGRVYPGTWADVGALLTWKPTFRHSWLSQPFQMDLGVVNGDACSQTRFNDALFSSTGLVARCERRTRDGEVDAGDGAMEPSVAHIDAFGQGFVFPDNNSGKSVVARLRLHPVVATDVGASFVWGRHPAGGATPEVGETTADVDQPPSWRVGVHLDVALDEIIQVRFPLPHVRGEFVYGRDLAANGDPTQVDRTMIGGYVQIAQPLFRRKRTQLPGLIAQYRFDHADPDRAVPGTVNGVPLVSDVTSAIYYRETAQQSHTVGLRFPVVPRFTLKAEYSWIREDGGSTNQLANDRFVLEAVADF